ncbi:MAG TPA: hypothetical protein PKG71_03070 [Candidatus Woesebacteria bacterium]|nr:hypothetical protein [Candidatus Woesebacteria bacterium]HNS94924.1 hypothetical protein [Candidatus Woesebacteria bacterium]
MSLEEKRTIQVEPVTRFTAKLAENIFYRLISRKPLESTPKIRRYGRGGKPDVK